MAARCFMVELQRNSHNWTKVVNEIVRTEKKIFPKHESIARSFDDELKKRNGGLLYLEVEGDVARFVLHSCPSSVTASITKLAENNFGPLDLGGKQIRPHRITNPAPHAGFGIQPFMGFLLQSVDPTDGAFMQSNMEKCGAHGNNIQSPIHHLAIKRGLSSK